MFPQTTVAERFASSLRRIGTRVTVQGDREVLVEAALTPDLDRVIEAAAHVLRVTVEYGQVDHKGAVVRLVAT